MIRLGIAFVASTALFVTGYFYGNSVGIKKHDNFVAEIQQQTIAQLIQQQELSHELESIGNEYYEKYQDALNAEPVTVTVTERVFIKADCPDPTLPKNTTREVGNGAATTRAELPRATTKRITELSNKWEQNLLQCEAQRNSLLSKIKAYNNASR